MYTWSVPENRWMKASGIPPRFHGQRAANASIEVAPSPSPFTTPVRRRLLPPSPRRDPPPADAPRLHQQDAGASVHHHLCQLWTVLGDVTQRLGAVAVSRMKRSGQSTLDRERQSTWCQIPNVTKRATMVVTRRIRRHVSWWATTFRVVTCHFKC